MSSPAAAAAALPESPAKRVKPTDEAPGVEPDPDRKPDPDPKPVVLEPIPEPDWEKYRQCREWQVEHARKYLALKNRYDTARADLDEAHARLVAYKPDVFANSKDVHLEKQGILEEISMYANMTLRFGEQMRVMREEKQPIYIELSEGVMYEGPLFKVLEQAQRRAAEVWKRKNAFAPPERKFRTYAEVVFNLYGEKFGKDFATYVAHGIRTDEFRLENLPRYRDIILDYGIVPRDAAVVERMRMDGVLRDGDEKKIELWL